MRISDWSSDVCSSDLVDAVLVTPPVFGMYAVCARLQLAPLVEVPLRDGDEDFSIDLAAVAELAQRKSARLVFLCSPGNPAGGSVSAGAVLDFARRLRGQALVVVDEDRKSTRLNSSH